VGRRSVAAVAGVWLSLLSGWVSDDAPSVALDTGAVDEECAVGVALLDGERELVAPWGRAIGALDRPSCEAVLHDGGVAFEPVPDSEAPGIAHPVRLSGPIGGIRIVPSGGDRHSIRAIADCRLAVALLRWAPALRARKIAAIEYVSIYRPGARIRGTHRMSGHARGLAIDVLAIVLDEGIRLSVLEGWTDRARGADPCADRRAEQPIAARLRGALCDAVERDLFQVVLTPHHDSAHANHLHFEIRPGVDWAFVR
jgi:hypothetical protein